MDREPETYKFDAPQPVTSGPAQHPGPWIKSAVLEPFGLSVSRTAELLGLNRPGLSRTLSGEYAVTADLAYKLEALTGIDADLLISMQSAFERDRDRHMRDAYRKAITRLELPKENTA